MSSTEPKYRTTPDLRLEPDAENRVASPLLDVDETDAADRVRFDRPRFVGPAETDQQERHVLVFE
ncbi:hypothetical protein BRC65_04105 [Halobacteriales archaeon QH_2_65_14]|nr:MAG: hypothetical protein BRC65_04105 [Halobacteriales archaeon QH_2_65_14]